MRLRVPYPVGAGGRRLRGLRHRAGRRLRVALRSAHRLGKHHLRRRGEPSRGRKPSHQRSRRPDRRQTRRGPRGANRYRTVHRAGPRGTLLADLPTTPVRNPLPLLWKLVRRNVSCLWVKTVEWAWSDHDGKPLKATGGANESKRRILDWTCVASDRKPLTPGSSPVTSSLLTCTSGPHAFQASAQVLSATVPQ